MENIIITNNIAYFINQLPYYMKIIIGTGVIIIIWLLILFLISIIILFWRDFK